MTVMTFMTVLRYCRAAIGTSKEVEIDRWVVSCYCRMVIFPRRGLPISVFSAGRARKYG